MVEEKHESADEIRCLASLKTTQRLCKEATKERLDSHSARLIKMEDTLRGKNSDAGLIGKVSELAKSVKEAVEDFKIQSQAIRTVMHRWMGALLITLAAVVISNFVR